MTVYHTGFLRMDIPIERISMQSFCAASGVIHQLDELHTKKKLLVKVTSYTRIYVNRDQLEIHRISRLSGKHQTINYQKIVHTHTDFSASKQYPLSILYLSCTQLYGKSFSLVHAGINKLQNCTALSRVQRNIPLVASLVPGITVITDLRARARFSKNFHRIQQPRDIGIHLQCAHSFLYT